MAQTPIKLPPVPPHLASDPHLYRWLQDLVRLFSAQGGIDPSQISFGDVALEDLGERDHAMLTGVEGYDVGGTGTTRNKHVSDADMRSLNNRIDAAANASSGAQADVDALDARVASLEARMSAVEATNTAQQSELDNHEARLVAGGL